ncbi:MAG TPA: MBL fold metallo-hydrolase [Acidimicrobiales bacterium]|jgi:endonuclease III|nr:MBL fold metallo-hydrolase [Acidimicrobiales bacterium]
MAELRLRLLGVGAMRSPRYAPAGLLVSYGGTRVALDGGPGAAPEPPLDAWLVCDERSELRTELRRLARDRDVEAAVAPFRAGGLSIEPRPVAHTSHPTVGYVIAAGDRRVAWAPEFWTFPDWAAGVDLLFADAAGWSRPIHFAGGVGGHAAALAVADEARRRGVARLVFAHVGRPTIRAIDAGERPPFGELGADGRGYRLRIGRRAGGKTARVAAKRQTPKQTARAVLDAHAQTYAEEAGIRLRDAPAPLYQLLCLSLLMSARIRANIAVAAARALFAQGWRTPRKLAASTWERRAKVLNEAGYARYDERTARMLAGTADLLLDRWHGDLRRLREEADRDPARERELLQEFPGIGPVGADIFAREVQAVWPEHFPAADDRTLKAAGRLGLGDDARALARLVPRRDFPRLVDGLVRAELEGSQSRGR